MYEVSQLVYLNFGQGTWQGIINERARRLREHKEPERRNRPSQDKHEGELMIGSAVILELLTALGIFVFLYLKFV